MAIKPVPRKRRREKELRQAKIISFIAGSLLLLAKLSLIYPVVLVMLGVEHLIVGSFNGFGRTAVNVAVYILITWAILCVMSIIRIAIKGIATEKARSAKYRQDDSAERIDKINRNTSRKRISKQKTLARRAAKKKRKQ